jgi:hypothetical protein
MLWTPTDVDRLLDKGYSYYIAIRDEIVRRRTRIKQLDGNYDDDKDYFTAGTEVCGPIRVGIDLVLLEHDSEGDDYVKPALLQRAYLQYGRTSGFEGTYTTLAQAFETALSKSDFIILTVAGLTIAVAHFKDENKALVFDSHCRGASGLQLETDAAAGKACAVVLQNDNVVQALVNLIENSAMNADTRTSKKTAIDVADVLLRWQVDLTPIRVTVSA